MQKIRSGISALFGAAVFSVLCIAPHASAVAITDVVDPTDTFINFGSTPSPCPTGFTCTTSALSFVHDISDGLGGFVVGVDTITSATVAIHLLDGTGNEAGNEDYAFLIGLSQTFSGSNVPSNATGTTEIITLNAAALADLQADGMITVRVSSTSGNFYFADSLLTAQVTRGVVGRIPEPSTALLLGAGLAGFGWRFRRRS